LCRDGARKRFIAAFKRDNQGFDSGSVAASVDIRKVALVSEIKVRMFPKQQCAWIYSVKIMPFH
jgi:hypothetical protein